MVALLRLIRLPNLLIIILTMTGVRYGVFQTLWKKAVSEMLGLGFSVQGLSLHMSDFNFVLLMISVLCIAAAGNIINDYFDTKTDRANRPDKVVVGRIIKRRVAMAMHLSLNGIGLLLALWLCYQVHAFKLFGIFLFSVAGLWFYSTHLKRQLLSGNIVIALLVALVPMTVALFEFSSNAVYDLNVINLNIDGFGNELLRKGAFITIGYCMFAFLTNLVREIIKDMQDVEGDLLIGARTLPIVLGESYTKYFVLAIIIFTMALLAMVQQAIFNFGYTVMFWYLTFAVQIPILILTVILWRAWQKKHYANASLWSKLVITGGVLSMFMFRFLN
ncbi:MAG: geranylgeranylglycerol-phosphate geranylgeranyltransferase [Bacteroidia bacterium]